jgi:hypothetical protein
VMNLHRMRHILVDAAAGAQVTTDATRVIWTIDIHSIEWGPYFTSAITTYARLGLNIPYIFKCHRRD